MSKDREPSSTRNHLDAADSACMRAQRILEEVDETRKSIKRLRVSSSANLTATTPSEPANSEQSVPLPPGLQSTPSFPPFKRDFFTITRRRH